MTKSSFRHYLQSKIEHTKLHKVGSAC